MEVRKTSPINEGEILERGGTQNLYTYMGEILRGVRKTPLMNKGELLRGVRKFSLSPINKGEISRESTQNLFYK